MTQKKNDYEEKLKTNAILGTEMVSAILKGAPFDATKAKIASMAITQYQRYRANL